jgi:hypothetical protein
MGKESKSFFGNLHVLLLWGVQLMVVMWIFLVPDAKYNPIQKVTA